MTGSGYRRYFMIFRQEDEGFGAAGREPSGHMKIEIRGGRGRLDAYFANLVQLTDGCYRLYLVKTNGEAANPIDVGSVRPGTNETHIRWEFDPLNTGKRGFGIESWGTAVLLVQGSDADGVASPLVAYREGRTEWRRFFRREKVSEPEKKEESDTFPGGRTEIQESTDINGLSIESSEETPDDDQDMKCKSMDVAETDKKCEEIAVPDQAEKTPPEPEEDDRGTERDIMKEDNRNDEFAVDEDIGKPEMEKFEELLDRDFQKADPFKTIRKDYDWWKVESPVHLNNVLRMCGIRAPLLFNKEVMTAHYKYRHLIAGIFCDEENGRCLVVCGVPGAFMVDQSPFGSLCRWVRAGGYRPGYGSMGYWLVYMDPNTGNILKVN